MAEIDPLAEELQIYLDEIEANRDPDDNEIDAYARIKNRVEGDREALNARWERERAKLDANHARMTNELENRDKAIEWKYGPLIRQLVAAKIQGMKQRSLKTLFGVVGYRKTPAKVLRRIREGQEDELKQWATQFCPEALVEKRTFSIAKGELPELCPHIYDETIPEADVFYWRPAKTKEKPNDRQE